MLNEDGRYATEMTSGLVLSVLTSISLERLGVHPALCFGAYNGVLLYSFRLGSSIIRALLATQMEEFLGLVAIS